MTRFVFFVLISPLAPVSLLSPPSSRTVFWLCSTATLLMLPERYTPSTYKCPFSPWLPSAGVLVCLHLIGSLGWPAYVRWVVWFTL